MGIYINPTTETKEEWLNREAIIVEPKFPPFPGDVLVCFIENSEFSAAGVIFTKEEFDSFNDLDDFRPRFWFSVSWKKLNGVISEFYYRELEKHFEKG